VRGGGRDPGVRRPGAGLGRPTARSKFVLLTRGAKTKKTEDSVFSFAATTTFL